MKPKEKAKELVMDFCSPSDIVRPNIASCRNASIAVDKILFALNDINGEYNMSNFIDWWEEVKEEIEKL